MSVFKNIFCRIWALWGLIIFSVTVVIVVIPICITFLVKEPAGTEIFRRISKIWMQIFLALIACPLRIKGDQSFEKGKTYIVVSNHNSLMDVPVTTPFVPGANKTIAKKSFTKAPLFGWIYRRGAVLVDRDSDESRRKSYDDMKNTLASGLHMVIYPEGTRNRTGDPLKKFYDGAFKLAVESGNSIIPTLIFNTRKVLPPNKTFYLDPHHLEMHFLPAVSSQNITAKELKEKVFKVMWDYYQENSK
jgi:1-acyl-sn-glycerol-3-phosphate acyltransferase